MGRMELSDRKKRILKSIVDSYIESGEPIGSKYLTTSCDFTVSPATIRNEMSELEDMGYLAQPHTSAGRVPTALGFKTYVSSLMEQYRLTMEELQLLNELTNFKANELGNLLEQASKVISKMTNCASFTVFRTPEDTVTRYETVAIDGSSFLIVLICENDIVKSGRVKSRFEVTPEAVKAIQSAMNANLTGLRAGEITMPVFISFERALGEYGHFASECVKAVYELLSADEKEKVHFDGVTKLLSYPEFSNISNAKNVLSMMEEHSQLLDILADSDSGGELNVYIGDDSDVSVPAKDASLVFHPIKCNGATVGAIGVIGPKRMDYRKAVASIDYLASCISEELEGNQNKPVEDGIPKDIKP